MSDTGPKDIKKELADCSAKRDEYLAGWQRAKADFLNYKKEEAMRFQDIARYSIEEVLRDFISVLDSFDLGLAAMEKAGPVEKGVYMIRAQIEDTMKRYGLTRIPVKPGDPFDPAIAESIAEVTAEQPPGTVVEEVETGYKLYDKVVRPARVKIAKNKGI